MKSTATSSRTIQTEIFESTDLQNISFGTGKIEFTAIIGSTKFRKPVPEVFCDLDADLFNDCKKSDPKAQFQFYKLYYKAGYELSLNIVNDTTEAESITQESFLVAFEKIGFFLEAESFVTWFKTYVKNRSNYTAACSQTNRRMYNNYTLKGKNILPAGN